MTEDVVKFEVKHWAVKIHMGKISTSLYGFVRDMSIDLPHSYCFGLSGISAPKEIYWQKGSKEYIPKYVKEAVYKKVAGLVGKQNVRKGF